MVLLVRTARLGVDVESALYVIKLLRASEHHRIALEYYQNGNVNSLITSENRCGYYTLVPLSGTFQDLQDRTENRGHILRLKAYTMVATRPARFQKYIA